MSGEPPSKRQKTDKKGKWTHFKRQQGQKGRIEIGDRGFLATCNFREKDCRRETFNMLANYADQFYGVPAKSPATANEGEEEADDDISKELQNEIDAINSTTKKKLNRFQHADTDIANLVFVKTTLANPVELGAYIIGDIVDTRKSFSRYLLRFIPVEVVCKATIEDMKVAAGKYPLRCDVIRPELFFESAFIFRTTLR